jgi:peroxiredoxin
MNVKFSLLLLGAVARAVAGVSFDLSDAEGRRHAMPAAGEAKAVVFVFIGLDCPISNSYAPELGRLYGEYSKRGVVFYAVQSDPSVAPAEVRRHARESGLPFPILLDPVQTLARQLGATATPEAAVVSAAGGELLYRGRIDDRVVDFGKARQRPTRQDLRLALEEVVEGKAVSRRITKAVGCAIARIEPSSGAKVTFARDVAPILYKHCSSCHHAQGAAPFALLTYEDAVRRAALIAAVTAKRYMPPWKPEPGYAKFVGERRLSVQEIAVLRDWAAAGAPEGNPAATPLAPKFSEGWQLGKPDLVAKMPEPFRVAADGPDVYRCFVVPMSVAQNRYIKAIEFQPQDRSVVHHALFFADPGRIAREKDAADPGPGYACFGSPGFLPARGLGGWTPGSGPIELPADAPTTLPKSSDLVLQIHFHPTGKAESEQSSLALYFTDTAPTRQIIDIPLGSNQIDIPPGERAYKVRDHFTLPVGVEAIGIIPHAHYICKDMKGLATLPDGTKKSLIWIRDWDFNWQEQYRYATPMRLPGDTRLEMEFTYDNSDENPRNPSHPAKRVLWGPELTDEMAGLHLQVIPSRMAELPQLTEALRGKLMRSVGGKFFRLEQP